MKIYVNDSLVCINKKRLLSQAVIITICILFNCIVSATNLLPNGNFEGEISPSIGYGATASISNCWYRRHIHSCCLTQTTNYGGLYIPIELENGKTYSYSAWVRYDPNSPAGQGICIAFIASNGAIQTYLNSTPSINNFDDWTNISGTITMQQTLQDQYLVIYANAGSGLQTFYVDNVELKEITN